MGSKNVKVISRDSSTQAQWNQWTCFVRMYILGPSWPDGDPSADCLATGEPGEPGEPGKVSLKTKHNIARPNNPIPWKHLKTENFSIVSQLISNPWTTGLKGGTAKESWTKNRVRNLSVLHSRLALPMLYQCWYNGFPTHTVPVSYFYVKSMSHSWGAKWHLSPRLPGTRPLPGGSASANIRLYPKALASLLTQNTQNKSRHIPTAFYLFYSNIYITYCYITIERKKNRIDLHWYCTSHNYCTSTAWTRATMIELDWTC